MTIISAISFQDTNGTGAYLDSHELYILGSIVATFLFLLKLSTIYWQKLKSYFPPNGCSKIGPFSRFVHSSIYSAFLFCEAWFCLVGTLQSTVQRPCFVASESIFSSLAPVVLTQISSSPYESLFFSEKKDKVVGKQFRFSMAFVLPHPLHCLYYR